VLFFEPDVTNLNFNRLDGWRGLHTADLLGPMEGRILYTKAWPDRRWLEPGQGWKFVPSARLANSCKV